MKTLLPTTKWEVRQKKGFQNSYKPLQEAVDTGTDKGYDFESFSQDVFGSFYQPIPKFPEGEASSGQAWHKTALDELANLPEYKQLRHSGSIGDNFSSGLATSVLTSTFAKTLKENQTENPDSLQQQIESLESILEQTGSQKAKDALEKAKQALPGAIAERAEKGPSAQDLRIALRNGLQAAKEKIDEVNATTGPFGFSNEPGKDGFSDPASKLALANKIAGNPLLAQIAALAGRFQFEARSIRANKPQPGPDEITDIECGDDFSRLLTSELVQLGDDLLSLDFARKLVDKSLLQYRLETNEKKVKGPIVVCLDVSGSMHGAKEIWSKAIAIALCWIASQEKRSFSLIQFNSGIVREDCFPNGKIESAKLLEAVSCGVSGGTNFDLPLGKAFDAIRLARTARDADAILITDGICTVDSAKVRTELEATGSSLFVIGLDGVKNQELESVASSYTLISSIVDANTVDDGAVKKTIFQI